MRAAKYVVTLVAAVLALTLAVAAIAWFARARGPRVNTSATPGELRWKVKASSYAANPVACGGAVVCRGKSFWSYGKIKFILLACDGATGKKVWGRSMRGDVSVVDGQTICAGDYKRSVELIDAAGGKTKGQAGAAGVPNAWGALKLGGETLLLYDLRGVAAVNFKSAATNWEVKADVEFIHVGPSGAVTDGERVYVHTKDGYILCLDAATGKECYKIWMTQRGNDVWTIVAGEGLVFVWGMDWTFYAFDAKTGAEKWTWNGGTGRSYGNIVVWDGKVFVSKGTSCYCLDRESGKELWNAGGKSNRTYLTEENGILYCASGVALWALDAATGQERWMFKTGSFATAPPALTKDTAFLTTFDGYLYAIAEDPEPAETKK